MLYADDLAQAVLNACQLSHISVPDQIGLVGVDNDLGICENLRPTLSSVLPDFEGAGYYLMDQVLKHLNDDTGSTLHPPYGVRAVIERDSTRDLRCGGLLVTRLDTYLREHFTEKLNIGEIARQFNTSRRLMELRFRQIRSCTILERISALRLEKAQHMLTTSTIPVSEIAPACGYGTDRAFLYAFKRATGLSPRQYRNTAESR